MTIPGIDVTTAATMVAAIGDIHRFPSAKKLVGYLGIDPRVRQSGQSPARQGRISKQGSSNCRRVLGEAAWSAIKTPGPLRAFYLRVKARRSAQVAIVATARKLACPCWQLLTTEQDYAFKRQTIVDRKLRALELRAGAPTRHGAQHSKGTPTIKQRAFAERALTEQAELAYQRLVQDWQATATNRNGAGAAPGRASQRPSSGTAARHGSAPLVGVGEPVDGVEAQHPPVRPRGLERVAHQLGEPVGLSIGEIAGVAQPQVAAVGQQLAMLAPLGLANLIDGLGELRLDVVAIEGDLRCRQVLERPGEVGLAHVLADLGDLLSPRVVSPEILSESGIGAGVTAGSGEHDAGLVEVGEHRHVVLATPEARLIDRDPLNAGEILAGERAVDVVVHDPPEPGVVLTDQLPDRPDGHLGRQGHDQRLEQQREPAARPRPRHCDQPNPVLRAAHPGHPRLQERLMLKEVQVPPKLGLGVVDRTAGRVALRAREPGAALEVDPQLKPTPFGIEGGTHHSPRHLKAQRRLKQLDISHPARLRRSRDQPTRISEGPSFTPKLTGVPRILGRFAEDRADRRPSVAHRSAARAGRRRVHRLVQPRAPSLGFVPPAEHELRWEQSRVDGLAARTARVAVEGRTASGWSSRSTVQITRSHT